MMEQKLEESLAMARAAVANIIHILATLHYKNAR